jgi:hypothetical protein
MTTPGQRRAQQARGRLEKFQFYVDCLTSIERSKLVARYLRKATPKYRTYLLQTLTLPELALCEVLSLETYGW